MICRANSDLRHERDQRCCLTDMDISILKAYQISMTELFVKISDGFCSRSLFLRNTSFIDVVQLKHKILFSYNRSSDALECYGKGKRGVGSLHFCTTASAFNFNDIYSNHRVVNILHLSDIVQKFSHRMHKNINLKMYILFLSKTNSS